MQCEIVLKEAGSLVGIESRSPGSFLSTFECRGTTVRYPWDPATGRIGLQMIPTSLLGVEATRRCSLKGLSYIDAMPDLANQKAFAIDSLAQIKIVGDAYPGGFAQGQTMRNSASVESFSYERQFVERERGNVTVTTRLGNAQGHRLEHYLSWHEDDDFFQISTVFYNDSPQAVTLEMISSFSLGGITPFDSEDSLGRLLVHRFRSGWSAEGRLETRSIEELHLERSWSGHAVFSERFGQVGSLPVRKWFPFVAVEDTAVGVIWGARLAWGGSWQMEIFRQHDDLSVSGGLADREFGHWLKTFQPGEGMATPAAVVSCVQGSLDDICDRLVAAQERAADQQPAGERSLPIIFNEWCTTYGNPQHKKVLEIADRLKGSVCKYLVIDAGWYKRDDVNWSESHGDWMPSPALFPEGLEITTAAIRERGLIPGIWFEIETVGPQSTAFSRIDYLLKRDGLSITSGMRRFWDMNNPAVIDLLTERVIDLLERCGIGYLKIDYNESIGIGCDDKDSLGEGLRKQIQGTYRFFQRIRERLPELVIENCSSGGHRLETTFLGLSAMSSFSDAHELDEIPIIAANLQRLILPRQSQIWAVLRRSDSDQRLAYSLAATFLGRMCLSGEITELSTSQWQIVCEAQLLYQRAVPIIKEGTSRIWEERNPSWRHPQGWQAVVRIDRHQLAMLVVVHTFAMAPDVIRIPLDGGLWHISGQFPRQGASLDGMTLEVKVEADFSARIILLRKEC